MHKQHPWSKGPEQGAGCEPAVEAVGSVFPGVRTQLPVDIPGQHQTRPPLCPRGHLQLSLFERRGDSGGVRVPAPQERSSPGFASSREILDSRIRVHPVLPPSLSLLSHRGAAPPTPCKAFLDVLRWWFIFVPLRGHLCCFGSFSVSSIPWHCISWDGINYKKAGLFKSSPCWESEQLEYGNSKQQDFKKEQDMTHLSSHCPVLKWGFSRTTYSEHHVKLHPFKTLEVQENCDVTLTHIRKRMRSPHSLLMKSFFRWMCVKWPQVAVTLRSPLRAFNLKTEDSLDIGK